MILELVNQLYDGTEGVGKDLGLISKYIEEKGSMITETMDKLDAAIDMEAQSIEIVSGKLVDLTVEIIIWLFKIGIREVNYKQYIIKAKNRLRIISKFRKIILGMELDAKGKELIELGGYDLLADIDNVESDYLNIMIRIFKIHLGAMMGLNYGAVNEKGLVDIFEDLQDILQSEIEKDLKEGKRGVGVFIDGFSGLE